MATVIAGPPTLTGELALYHTTDPLLGNSPVLIFHGPAASIGSTSSRIQVHIFTPAGLGSYSRLSVSPNSPFYSAVSNLPREEQGDEVCRGLAFGLKKYFSELSESVRKIWCTQVKAPSPGALFGDDHIAILATRMSRIENFEEVVTDISQAFCDQRLSWLDIDVVLPPGAVQPVSERPVSSGDDELDDMQLLRKKYGRYAELVFTLGEVAFLPTSRLKRAPSKATAIGRTLSFTSSSKEHVQKELKELVTTEQSYVGRLKELCDLSASLDSNVESDDKERVSGLFPSTIDKILEANSKFLDDIRIILESTAELGERATAPADHTISTEHGADSTSDTLGVSAVAKCLCEALPMFEASYKEYLLKHAQASQILRDLFRSGDHGDPLVAALQDVGEQKVISLLIEPVQRLPRYNLYIDGITKQLPVRHPALKPLLQARDMITDICAESESSEASTIIARLQSRTLGWPSDIQVNGRLITAADYVELLPPYGLEKCEGDRGMLLLFTDGIIVLEKSNTSKTNARTFLTELESGTMSTRSAETSPNASSDLHFIRRLQLDAVQCTESHEGQVLQLLSFFELGVGALAAREPILDSCQIVRLEHTYDAKVSRFTEELAKAKVESRFSEAERESAKWEFRSTDPAPDSLGLFSAIYGDADSKHLDDRGTNAAVRVLVDVDRHKDHPVAGQDGIRTVVKLAPGREGDWRISFDSIDGSLGKEHVEMPDLVPVIRRKLAALVSGRLSIEQSAMTTCLLRQNKEILQSIDLQTAPKGQDSTRVPNLEPRERFNLPRSPKKLLSSFLSSVGPGSESLSVSRRDSRELPVLPGQTSLSRLSSTASKKPPSRESRPSSRDQTAISFSSTSTEPTPSGHRKLEDTLSAYILALEARKGNIVGRNLKNRLVADELLVNELYNSLLEDPGMMVLAAQAPLDVLFAAFEKFLNVAWKDNFGEVMPGVVIQDIQTKAETLFPRDFDEYFRTAMGQLAPQNQRAFRAIMQLLADLLDGTGNDGDRGILTAYFAELLVTEGNPHNYIALIDRFVDDTDTYFGEPLEEQRHQNESSSSQKRARSMNSASLTSNTSSLRRKFGFGTLSHENSKVDPESKVASVWRSLSKNNRTDPSPHGSISKASLSRSQSIDDGRQAGSARPRSQDGLKPTVLNELSSTSASGHASSNQPLGLSTIGEHPSFIPTGPPRKKRRSSLSDLQSVEGTPAKVALTVDSPRRSPLRPVYLEEKELPKSPTSSTPSSKANSGRFGTPQASPRSRLPASFRTELSPAAGCGNGHGDQARPKSSGSAVDEVVITTRQASNIPSLMPRPTSTHTSGSPTRGGLSERYGAGNIVKKPSPQPEKTRDRGKTDSSAPQTPAISPRKLRMQSPQKLRERLQTEQSFAISSQNTLQDELTKIGEELTSSFQPPSHPSLRGSPSKTIASSRSPAANTTLDLTQRILKLEAQLPQHTQDLTSRIDTIHTDLLSSLTVSEAKCKNLDDLYREANAENEALYARFNDELGKIMKAVRKGEGVEELKRKLKESQDEAAGLRREAGRLRREVVGLRAQLRE